MYITIRSRVHESPGYEHYHLGNFHHFAFPNEAEGRFENVGFYSNPFVQSILKMGIFKQVFRNAVRFTKHKPKSYLDGSFLSFLLHIVGGFIHFTFCCHNHLSWRLTFHPGLEDAAGWAFSWGENRWNHQTIRDDLAKCFAFWSPERVDPTHSFLFLFSGWLAC